MKKSVVERLLTKAAKTNAHRDKVEKADGLRIPTDGPLEMFLDTVYSALTAGMVQDDWTCIAEAAVMLQQMKMKIMQKKGGMN